MKTNKVAIVTGGSSGIGLCAARALRDAGCAVYEFSRRDHTEEGVHHLSVDVTDELKVAAAVKTVFETEGRIDILVNNAGFGISGAAEFTENADAKRLLDVNLFGMVNMSKAVLPVMREARGGRIVNVSSFAALTPIPFQTWYSVSKSAVSAYTMALANEIRPFGITVCAVLPGDIKTGFTASREKKHAGNELYGGRIDRNVARMEQDEIGGMDPMIIGNVLRRTALSANPKVQRTVGFAYNLFAVLLKLLPTGLVNKILYLMYAK